MGELVVEGGAGQRRQTRDVVVVGIVDARVGGRAFRSFFPNRTLYRKSGAHQNIISVRTFFSFY
jgi:hypothetical protein